ncbi:MAG: hypothetical protein KZQ74_13695 [gamma proteobacterium symbiont of Bathyaustriella thionipta]|nr:hypothetical protein [gamma proteobacterium symbiont of Bathyaustriella thionipta]MCU7957926.1 hypothetical protein [gamma proteobacterium symbiont of Bathyaustriella thionipta]MCU7968224.1 hypothetical protein [gamma proteobacterium symbiont of Bathyaustriella thionipta]
MSANPIKKNDNSDLNDVVSELNNSEVSAGFTDEDIADIENLQKEMDQAEKEEQHEHDQELTEGLENQDNKSSIQENGEHKDVETDTQNENIENSETPSKESSESPKENEGEEEKDSVELKESLEQLVKDGVLTEEEMEELMNNMHQVPLYNQGVLASALGLKGFNANNKFNPRDSMDVNNTVNAEKVSGGLLNFNKQVKQGAQNVTDPALTNRLLKSIAKIEAYKNGDAIKPELNGEVKEAVKTHSEYSMEQM